MKSFFDELNPLTRVSHEGYLAAWQAFFSTTLEGFWGRFIAAAFLLLSFWAGVKRRNFVAAGGFFFLAILVTYGAPVFRLLGLL